MPSAEIVADAERAQTDRRAAGIGVGVAEGELPGAVLDHRAGAGDDAVQRHSADLVERHAAGGDGDVAGERARRAVVEIEKVAAGGEADGVGAGAACADAAAVDDRQVGAVDTVAGHPRDGEAGRAGRTARDRTGVGDGNAGGYETGTAGAARARGAAGELRAAQLFTASAALATRNRSRIGESRHRAGEFNADAAAAAIAAVACKEAETGEAARAARAARHRERIRDEVGGDDRAVAAVAAAAAAAAGVAALNFEGAAARTAGAAGAARCIPGYRTARAVAGRPAAAATATAGGNAVLVRRLPAHPRHWRRGRCLLCRPSRRCRAQSGRHCRYRPHRPRRLS